MSEKLPQPQFESAERKFEMDSYEVRALPFAQDPVGYLKNFVAEKLATGYGEQDIVFKIVDEFTSLVMAVADGDVKTENENLRNYIYADSAYEQKKALVALMRDIGVRREHLKVWAGIVVADSSNGERLEERSYGVAISEVYGHD